MTQRDRDRGANGARGAVSVEFALLLPLLLLFTLGIYDFGRLQYERVVVTSAAYEAARASALWTSTSALGATATAAALTAAQTAAGNIPVIIKVAPSKPGCTSAGINTVTVSALHNGQERFNFLTPGLTALNVTVKRVGAFRCLVQ